MISMACMNLLHARNTNLIVLVLVFAFLLMSTLTPFHQSMAQGRQFHNAHMIIKDEEMMIGRKMRSVIGSRPPKCEQRCRNCGHCEAVQVPIAPAIKFFNFGKRKTPQNTNTIQYSRGDDISSYKPMCWKCKCGNFFFNP